MAQWYRSQMQLRFGMAVAKVGGYSSDSTPNLETSICLGCGPKKPKKKKKKEREVYFQLWLVELKIGISSIQSRLLSAREVSW